LIIVCERQANGYEYLLFQAIFIRINFSHKRQPVGGRQPVLHAQQMGEWFQLTFNLGFYPGIAYAISPHVQLETGFQNLFYATCAHNKTTIDGSTEEPKSDSFGLGSSFSGTLGGFTVGFKWLL